MDSTLLSATAPLYADVVWPALFLEQRILSVLPIAVGLVVEWLALWLGGFGLPCKRAVVISVSMNAVSTLLGIILIPIAGLGWEVLAAPLFYRVLDIGTFNPGTWAAASTMAVLLNTAVEASVLQWVVKIPLNRRRICILCAANCATVAIAFVSLWINPPRP